MAIIRVTGYPGSGKTTICRRLAPLLNYKHYYVGAIFRDMAEERSLSIEEFYRTLVNDPKTEREVDDRLSLIMQTEDNVIIEGRMAPFLPAKFKTHDILFTVSKEEGARRLLERPENIGKSIEEMMALTEGRIFEEKKHYKELYGIEDHFLPSHFNIVIDTTSLTIDEVFEGIIKQLSDLGVGVLGN